MYINTYLSSFTICLMDEIQAFGLVGGFVYPAKHKLLGF